MKAIPLRKKTLLLVAGTLAALTLAAVIYRNRPEGKSSLGESVSITAPAAPTEQSSSHEDSSQTTTGHALDPLIAVAEGILVGMRENVHDYTATMVKRERIGGRLGAEVTMEMKLRCRSDSSADSSLAVYLKFTAPSSSAGREVIWCESKRDGKLVSHEGGFKNWTRITLAPTGMLAMAGNKYPITEVGLRRLAEKLIEKGKQDREIGPCTVQTVPGQTIGQRSCTLYQITHAEKRDEFDFHIARIFVDDEWNIPLRYAAFMWPENQDQPPPVEEEYTFLNVQLNVGLTEADFDPENTAYKFP